MSGEGERSVAAVVLAAGSSTRMGENKLLLEINGEPLVRRAARIAGEAGLDPVLVVLGHEWDRVRPVIDDLASRVVINASFAEGKGVSLQLGIAEVRAHTTAHAAVVLLADMPFVTAPMLAATAERYARTGAPMVISRYGEVSAPPILYARPLFDELLALPNQACGKEMMRRHKHEAEVLAWPEEVLADVDLPADYERIRARLEAR
jgi:molybdenum cofactor cytidylyltransferase